MRRRFRRPKKFKTVAPRYRSNEQIRIPRVFVIGEHNEQIGEMDTFKAIALAKENDLDLVEVAPKANPPVCRILDFGKFQYQQAKKEQQQKANQKKTGTKGIRIGFRTDTHDLAFKKKQTEKFLEKGYKVKIEIRLRGREKAYQDTGRENLRAFLQLLDIPHKIEEDIKRFPGGFHVIIATQE
jgi:translation initiation factor IF-3